MTSGLLRNTKGLNKSSRFQAGMEQRKQKLKPEFKIADNFLDLRTEETNVVIQQIEENIRIREMPLEKRIKMKKLLQ